MFHLHKIKQAGNEHKNGLHISLYLSIWYIYAVGCYVIHRGPFSQRSFLFCQMDVACHLSHALTRHLVVEVDVILYVQDHKCFACYKKINGIINMLKFVYRKPGVTVIIKHNT